MTEETATTPVASNEAAPTALWDKLMATALTKPGVVAEGYTAFHTYSISNQVWLMEQHLRRNIPIGPCAGLKTWNGRGRMMKQGEKKFAVLAPLKAMVPRIQDDGTTKLIERVVGFRIQKSAVSFAQTYQVDGQPDWKPEDVPICDVKPPELLSAFGIKLVPFEDVTGNNQGYAQKGKEGPEIAVNPAAFAPAHTFLHEVAHVILGHIDNEACTDGGETPRSLKEAEAEGVVFLVSEVCNMGFGDQARGYIQNWWQEKGLPEGASKRIFSAAEKILRVVQNRPARSVREDLPKAA